MKTSVIGFSRIGRNRELKFASEKFFKGEIQETELQDVAREIRELNLTTQKHAGIDLIASNDFSFYDNVLDTAFLFNIIPQRYKDLGLSELQTYFAAARGYQGEKGNVKALAMKKWFNTNYHYIVPEFEDDTKIQLVGNKPVDEYVEARNLGVETKVQIVGPFTFLKLTKFVGNKKAEDIAETLTAEYGALFSKLSSAGASWIQIDEPYLVRDLDEQDKVLFKKIYGQLLSDKKGLKVLLQTYFGDVRDVYEEITSLDVDAIGLDFLEGIKTLSLLKEKGFPKEKILVAGVVNGKNIWKNSYEKTNGILNEIKTSVNEDNRQWNIDLKEQRNYAILKSRVVKIKKKL
ncbi:MAG: 5-methyltetrahydropteroyltriglutamate--homocysteine S-methyltransferase, partial [Lachnospiraceae bacterium]|nr:5-methyltetrahydropteroyltriglutamate--homocysteine S-methyltransferase [Lachnospiraceae bacterium]